MNRYQERESRVPMALPTVRQLPVSNLVPPRLGRYEEHWTNAGPEGKEEGMMECEEHGEMCAMRVTYSDSSIVRKIIFTKGLPMDLG